MAFHYVTAGGAGAKDGSSWSNAWAGNSMGTPSSGDTVLLGAGGSYSGLGPFTSGVTYTAVSSTAIGVGTTSANVSNGTTQQVILPGGAGYNFASVTNCVLTGGLWTPPWKTGGSVGPPNLYGILIHNAPASGGNIFSPGNNNSFINLEISGPASNGTKGYNQTTSQLSAFFGGDNALISGCKVHDMDGPFYYMMGGSVIEYCTIYNVSSDIQITGNPGDPHPDLSYNNQTSVGSSNPFGFVIRYCVFANCVSEGIFFDNFNNVAGGSFINLIMYGNLMFQGDTAGTVSGGASGQCDAIEIKTQAGNYGAFYIYNNTFVDWGVGSKPGLNSDGAGTISHLTAIRNNLFVNTTTQMDTADTGNIIQSNNGYYQASKSDSPADGAPTVLTSSPFPTTVSNPWTFAQASSRLGPAPNTQTRPIPLGYDPTAYIPSFKLAPGSLAVGKAVTLTPPASGNLGITHTFNVDMFGNTGANLGAFQGSAAAIVPAITLPAGSTLVFNQDFTTGAALSVSDSTSSNAVWYDHTPYNGDFGNAFFGKGQGDGKMFSTTGGTLTINCFWDTLFSPAHWQSGLISSIYPDGHGFSQALGYWETKIWCPPLLSGDAANTTGLWPAFYLDGVNGTTVPGSDTIEIDVIEAYSVDYTKYQTNWHVFKNGAPQSGGGATISPGVNVSSGYHIYSVWVTASTLLYYFDGTQVFSAPTPPCGQLPVYALVDLALGGGWPVNINEANTYKMLVQYVRCWSIGSTDTTPPSVPGSFTASAGPVVASQVTLSWSASTDNVTTQGAITYSIYQGTSGALIGTTSPGVTTFTQTGLAASTLFQYAITANDQAGNSSLKTATGASTSRTTGAVDATAPTSASGLTATAVSNTEIDLVWSSATDSPNAASTVSYNIFRVPGTSGTFTNIGSVGSGVLSFKNTGLSAGVEFTYKIQSKDFAGNLSAGFSNTSTATTPSAPILPTFIQAGPAEFNGTAAVGTSTYSLTQGSGDLNVVAIGWNTTGVTVLSVTDTSGNTYSAALAATNNGAFFQSIYYSKNIASAVGGNVVTVNMSGSASGLNVRILEYSNIDKANPIDVALGATGTSATASVGPITTTNAVDMLVAAAYTSDVNTGPGPGFAQRILQASGNIVEDELVQAIGSYTATSPAASTVNYVMQVVAFRGANVALHPPGPIKGVSTGAANVNPKLIGNVAGAPGLAQHVSTGMERNPMGTFSITLPNPVRAGNFLIFGCQYNAQSPSAVGPISDNLGNTWIAGVSGGNASFSNLNTFYCLNTKAGLTKITLATSGMNSSGFTSAFQAVVSEFFNVTGFDRQSISTISAFPPAVTPTLSGDLIWHWAIDGSDTTLNGGAYNSSTEIIPGSGFTLLSADLQTGSIAQFMVQPAAAPIAPSFTKSGAATWESVVMAFTSGLKGSAPTGMYIAHVQHTLLASAAAQGRPAPIAIQFPSQGNLLVGLYDSGDVVINSVSDSGGNTWHIAGTNVGADGGEPAQIVYGQGGTISNTLHSITAALSGTVTTDCMFILYDVVNASAPAFDLATNTSGIQSSPGTTLTTSTLTPRTPNGITFSTDSQFAQSMTGCVGGAYVFDSGVNSLNFNDTADGGTQTSTLDEDNGKAHIFNASLSPVTFVYTYNSTSFPIRSWGSVAAHFSSGVGLNIIRPFHNTPNAPAFVQGNTFNVGGSFVSVHSFSGAFGSNNAAGNSILVFVFSEGPTSPALVSDSQGNVYTLVSSAISSTTFIASAYVATNISPGPNTITASSGTIITAWDMQIAEYGPSLFDSAAHNIGVGATLTSGNIITQGNNEILVMYARSGSNTTLTPTGGFTTRVQDLTIWDGITADLIAPIANTYAGGFTSSTSNNWWVVSVSLIPASPPIASVGSSGSIIARGFTHPVAKGKSLASAIVVEQTVQTIRRTNALAAAAGIGSASTPDLVFRPEALGSHSVAHGSAFIQTGNTNRPRPSSVSTGIGSTNSEFLYYPSPSSGSNGSASLIQRFFCRPRAITTSRGTVSFSIRKLYFPKSSGKSAAVGLESVQVNASILRIHSLSSSKSIAACNPHEIYLPITLSGANATVSVVPEPVFNRTVISGAIWAPLITGRYRCYPTATGLSVCVVKVLTEIIFIRTRIQAISGSQSSGAAMVRIFEIRIPTVSISNGSSAFHPRTVFRNPSASGTTATVLISLKLSVLPTAISSAASGIVSSTPERFSYPAPKGSAVSSGKGITEISVASTRPQARGTSQASASVLIRIVEIRIPTAASSNSSSVSHPKTVLRNTAGSNCTSTVLIVPNPKCFPTGMSSAHGSCVITARYYSYPMAMGFAGGSGKEVAEVNSFSTRVQALSGSGTIGAVLIQIVVQPQPSGASLSVGISTSSTGLPHRSKAPGNSMCFASLLPHQVIRPRILASIQTSSQTFAGFVGIAIYPLPGPNTVMAGLIGGGAVTRKGFKPSEVQNIKSPQTTSGKSPLGVQPLPTPL